MHGLHVHGQGCGLLGEQGNKRPTIAVAELSSFAITAFSLRSACRRGGADRKRGVEAYHKPAS